MIYIYIYIYTCIYIYIVLIVSRSFKVMHIKLMAVVLRS